MNIEVRIAIGEYTFEPHEHEGKIWMSRDGEGMEVEEAKLAAALKQFYVDNF